MRPYSGIEETKKFVPLHIICLEKNVNKILLINVLTSGDVLNLIIGLLFELFLPMYTPRAVFLRISFQDFNSSKTYKETILELFTHTQSHHEICFIFHFENGRAIWVC